MTLTHSSPSSLCSFVPPRSFHSDANIRLGAPFSQTRNRRRSDRRGSKDRRAPFEREQGYRLVRGRRVSVSVSVPWRCFDARLLSTGTIEGRWELGRRNRRSLAGRTIDPFRTPRAFEVRREGLKCGKGMTRGVGGGRRTPVISTHDAAVAVASFYRETAARPTTREG